MSISKFSVIFFMVAISNVLYTVFSNFKKIAVNFLFVEIHITDYIFLESVKYSPLG